MNHQCEYDLTINPSNDGTESSENIRNARADFISVERFYIDKGKNGKKRARGPLCTSGRG